jgi:predicted metal-dependent phosphoesterase TrpH
MIDLHSHTNESDGTYTPRELVEAAANIGLEALGITDHDTFAGYELAAPVARERELDLVCGIEISTRALFGRGQKTVHMLGLFLGEAGPSAEFQAWVGALLASRRDRNIRLIRSLNEHGVDISLGEVEAMGRSLTGRPHFARVLMKKGYVRSTDEAFRRYLAESAPSYVERDSPEIGEAIREVAKGGGISVLAHPVRLGFRHPEEEERFIAGLKELGLRGIEVWHSDHNAADTARYFAISQRLGLLRSGGTDFHGGNKPGLELGTGRNGNVHVAREVLDQLRAGAAMVR